MTERTELSKLLMSLEVTLHVTSLSPEVRVSFFAEISASSGPLVSLSPLGYIPARTWILCISLSESGFTITLIGLMSWHLICKNPNRNIGVRSQTPCLFQNTGHASWSVLGLSFSSTKLTHHFILIAIERVLVIYIVTSLCQFSKYKTFFPGSIETTMYSD